MTDRVLVFSDLHAHAWAEFSSLVEHHGQVINSRLADAARVIDWVRRKALKNSINRVLFAGDLFHKKKVLDIPVFNVTAAALFRLAEVAEVTIMAGNHDLTRRSAEGSFSHEHALYALGGHPKITVVDEPTVIDGMGLVPYGADRDTTLKGVESCIRDGASWLVMHAGIAGAVTGPVEYQPYEPVTVDDLPNMPIYSGLYHMPQTVQKRVTYIGAPLELVRGDGRAKRGAMLIDMAGKSPERLRYKGPRFLTRQAWALDPENVEGHFVDLQLHDTGQVEAASKLLVAAGARSIHPVFVAPPVAAKARLSVDVEANGLPTVEALCQCLVETAEDGLDQKLLWHLAQEALHAADTTDD